MSRIEELDAKEYGLGILLDIEGTSNSTSNLAIRWAMERYGILEALAD